MAQTRDLGLQLDRLERRLELSERLRARGAADEADRLLGETIKTLGIELAKVDPVVEAMLELDAELLRLAALKIAMPADLVPVRRTRE